MVIFISAAIGGVVGFLGLIILIFVAHPNVGTIHIPSSAFVWYTLSGAALGAVVGAIIYFVG